MKRYLIILLIPIFLACGESEKEKKLQAEIDSLTKITGEDEETITEYMEAIAKIQDNLKAIKEKEKIITTRTSGDIELNETDVENINNDINAIYKLITENRNKLSYLNKKIKKSNVKASNIQNEIDKLTVANDNKDAAIIEMKTLLEQKDIDIKKLDEKIKDLSSDVSELEKESEEKTEVIDEQEKKLNTAYYVVGTKKFLKQKGIVTKQGGFVGLGGAQKINQKTDEFTEIDIRKIKEISLNSAKKVFLLSNHPESSYNLIQDEDKKFEKIVITNHETFWTMSKYLVIKIK